MKQGQQFKIHYSFALSPIKLPAECVQKMSTDQNTRLGGFFFRFFSTVCGLFLYFFYWIFSYTPTSLQDNSRAQRKTMCHLELHFKSLHCQRNENYTPCE